MVLEGNGLNTFPSFLRSFGELISKMEWPDGWRVCSGADRGGEVGVNICRNAFGVSSENSSVLH